MRMIAHQAVDANCDDWLAAGERKNILKLDPAHRFQIDRLITIGEIEQLLEALVIMFFMENGPLVYASAIEVVPLVRSEWNSAVCHDAIIPLYQNIKGAT